MSDEVPALNVTSENFMSDVIEASRQMPVLVDFWAPWCAPCRQLMPILDRLAADYRGRLKLAKVNTDEEQELAQTIGIRSLPTVALFKDGAALDHFVGALPEAQIRQMLDRHVAKAAETPLEHAQAAQQSGDLASARQTLQQALAREPDNIDLQTALAELSALEGDIDAARRELERLQSTNPTHTAVKRLAALLGFSEAASANSDVRALRERVASNPEDLDAQHALAVHQLLGGDIEPALQTWLDMMRNHRDYKDDLPRRSLVQAFDMLGEDHPLVPQMRRLMSRMLF